MEFCDHKLTKVGKGLSDSVRLEIQAIAAEHFRVQNGSSMSDPFTFEIPDTEKSRTFAARNPQFPAALLKLFDTANKCFGRDPRPKNQLENICFWLGQPAKPKLLYARLTSQKVAIAKSHRLWLGKLAYRSLRTKNQWARNGAERPSTVLLVPIEHDSEHNLFPELA